ncbi:AAA family ATPase, partial [Candidatus Frankia alpina]
MVFAPWRRRDPAARFTQPRPASQAPATDGSPASDGAGRPPARLLGEELTLAYDRRIVAEGLAVRIPDGAFTVIVGPNACGKSTLLRALARV